MEIFKITKNFPDSKKFALSSQIIRSSRSVCANIAEAYRKRDYIKHFKSKLTDADSENSETQLWLDFAVACKYVQPETAKQLEEKSIKIGKLINYMILNPSKFEVKKDQ